MDSNPQVLISSQDYRAQAIARSLEEAAQSTMSTTRPGGVYIVGGQAVDANGYPIGNKPAPTEAEIRAEADRRYEQQLQEAANTGAGILRAEEAARIKAAQEQRAAEEKAERDAARARSLEGQKERVDQLAKAADAAEAAAKKAKPDDKAEAEAAAKQARDAADAAAAEFEAAKDAK